MARDLVRVDVRVTLECDRELWNARMGAVEDVLGICLRAVDRANGRRSTNAMMDVYDDSDVRGKIGGDDEVRS